jgi:hypothetical protein
MNAECQEHSGTESVTGLHTELTAHISLTECNIGITQTFSYGVSVAIELKNISTTSDNTDKLLSQNISR